MHSAVKSGGSFTYDFPAKNAGTFWIHSHASGQYPKGLRSPLVIKSAAEGISDGVSSSPCKKAELFTDINRQIATSRDYTVTVSDW